MEKQIMTAQDFYEEAARLVPSISCDDFKKLEEEGSELVLLDVRTKEEFDEGHIDGALHIPRGVLEFNITEAVREKGKKIVICCGTGKRAALAGLTLQKMGYTDVHVLEGGYKGYCAAG